MNYDYGYDQGFQDGKNQAKSDKATKEAVDGIFKLSGSILSIIAGLLLTVIVFSGALIIAYMLYKTMGIAAIESTVVKISILLLTTYLVLCGLYFLKGMLISFKMNGNRLWILLWIVCFMIICVFPVYTIRQIISGIVTHPVLSWGLAMIAGIIICFRYNLTIDSTHILTMWSYRLGKNAVK